MVTLWLEMSELEAIMKVMMMAMGNSSQEGGALKQHGKVKVLNLTPYVGK